MQSIDLNLNYKGACNISGEVNEQPNGNGINYLMPLHSPDLMRLYSSEYPFEGMIKRDDGKARNIGKVQMEKLEKDKLSN